MQIKQLILKNFRGYPNAIFDFQPGMNLIVGVNGVGKSSVLEALRVMLIYVLPRISNIKMAAQSFSSSDIMNKQNSLTVELFLEHGNENFNYLRHQFREEYRSIGDEGTVRDATYSLETVHELNYYGPMGIGIPIDSNRKTLAGFRQSNLSPLSVYFSTRRSLISNAKGQQSGGLAFAGSLQSRELMIREFIDWWLVQEELGTSDRLQALNQAVMLFLDSFTNVRVVREPEPTLIFEKAGVELDVRQLSDGERGMLALVLDLARRLALANPELDDPIRDGKAVVLIDELDLHLHPQWQRTIVQRLTDTFPACQFIATTHSPQIIGEVAPENIILLENGVAPHRPVQSLGMDSNWILQVLMGTPDRNVVINHELERISDLIEDSDYDQARDAINRLRATMPSDPELVKLQTRLDRYEILGQE